MDKSYIIERIITSGMFITILGVVISPWLINPNFESFQISDWMISYQDGFIRRGLAGSILYYLHNNIIDISPIYFSISPILTGCPFIPRMHFPIHCL